MCEQLLETGEARGHRVPARVNDLRIRQDQVNQADVFEVVWHFVDEKRRTMALHSR